MKKLVFSLVMVLTLLTSCNSYKNVAYLQNSDLLQKQEVKQMFDAKIMPKDQLTITVNTSDPKLSVPFNLVTQSARTSNTDNITSQGALQSYLVDNEGNIEFPVLGTLNIGGKTRTEAQNMIKQKLQPYLNETPVVTVKITDFKISVLGEVNKPGEFKVEKEKINVLQALALAGDLTIWGVRDSVKLIREDAMGNLSVHKINLNDANFMTSPYFQLQQNDMLYVTPNKTKAKNSDVGTSTSLWFSATSILLSLATLLYNIFK